MKRVVNLTFILIICLVAVFTLASCKEEHVHEYGEWQTVSAATCTKAGKETRECLCGEKETRDTSALGHEEISHPSRAATCTENGWYAYVTCSRCEYSTYSEITASHNFAPFANEVSASCTTYGRKGYYLCFDCNKTFDSNKNEITDLTIPKLNHRYENGSCKSCGKTEPASASMELKYELVNNQYYKVVGIKTHKGSSVVIPESYKGLPVKEIANGAFKAAGISSVTIPGSITNIHEYAFEECYNLVEIINKSDLNLTLEDFAKDGDIESYPLEIHSGASKIKTSGKYEFYSLNGVNYLVNYLGRSDSSSINLSLPLSYNNADYKIYDFAFCMCMNIKSLHVPSAVKEIGNAGFVGCENLERVVIEEGLESIGAFGFDCCFELSSINIPDSLKHLGECPFEDSDGVCEIVNDSIIYVDSWLIFAGRDSAVIEIREGTRGIADSAFWGTNVGSLHIPTSLKYIGSDAFRNSNVTSLHIKNLDKWNQVILGNPDSNPIKSGTSLYLNNSLVVSSITGSAMSYNEYVAADFDSTVIIEAYVQGAESWWDNKITLFLADKNGGAYYVYQMQCSEEDSRRLVPGTKIKLTGRKTQWDGEVEIIDGRFEFCDASDTYISPAVDLTDVLANESELIKYMNRFASFNHLIVVEWSYQGGERGHDIYLTLSDGEKEYSFRIERYITGPETEVYQTVENLSFGDVVEVEGFVYWNEVVEPIITNVYVRATAIVFNDYSELGVNFALPPDMEKIDSDNDYVFYSNQSLDFEIVVISKNDLNNPSISLEEYTQWLITANGYDSSYEVISPDKTEFDIIWSNDSQDWYSKINVIEKNSVFYVIVCSCINISENAYDYLSNRNSIYVILANVTVEGDVGN